MEDLKLYENSDLLTLIIQLKLKYLSTSFFMTQKPAKQKTILISLINPNINKSNTKKLKSEHNLLSLQSEMSLNKNNFLD